MKLEKYPLWKVQFHFSQVHSPLFGADQVSFLPCFTNLKCFLSTS